MPTGPMSASERSSRSQTEGRVQAPGTARAGIAGPAQGPVQKAVWPRAPPAAPVAPARKGRKEILAGAAARAAGLCLAGAV